MRKVSRLSLSFLLAALGCTLLYAVPQATHVGDGPGFNADWHSSETLNEFGHYNFGPAGISFGGGEGLITNPQGFCRMQPSLKNDHANPVAMPTDEDWIFQVDYHWYSGGDTGLSLFVKANDSTADEARIFGIGRTATTADVSAYSTSGAWTSLFTFENLGDSFWLELVVHYKAASQTLDFYANGALIHSDWDTGYNRQNAYALNFWQVEPPQHAIASKDGFANWKLGQLVEVCGDDLHPIPLGDFDEDCDVDVNDLQVMLSQWLICNAPECD